MKTIIEMAREAGWEYADDDRGFEPLWHFADLVRAEQRNATLNEIVLFIENYVEGYDSNYRELGLELAAEIQARKT